MIQLIVDAEHKDAEYVEKAKQNGPNALWPKIFFHLDFLFLIRIYSHLFEIISDGYKID